MRRTGTRRLTAAQAVLGAGTVGLAGPVARRVSDSPEPWISPLIVVLGLRQVLQAALVYAVDDPLFLRGGAVVDALHAASMLPVAARSSRFRWYALASASAAAASSAAGFAVAAKDG